MPWLDWMSLFIRWFHVIAGVAWIGASFYFIWLDNNLRTPPEWKQQKGIKGDLWAIHGGGFYEVAKYSYGPETMPTTLHWFKWEAYTTWISGFALLILVYYFGASAFLIDPRVMALSPTIAILYGLGFIFGGQAIYELACRSVLAKRPKVFAGFLIFFVVFACWLATSLFSGRGAFIHVGALIGTIMAGNVLLNIMPAQRKMVAAVAAKKEVDPAWGMGAKLRSVHNNYFTLPLLFIMISNHYPMTYQHPQSWLVLVAFIGISAYLRHYFNLKHIGVNKPSILVISTVLFAALTLWVSWPQAPKSAESVDSSEQIAAVSQLNPLDKSAFALIQTHCVSCHSSMPTDEIFKVAPLGVILDDWDDIKRYAPQIAQRTAVTKDMPLLNKTNMTEQEREQIALWFAQMNQ
ncbi:urate hydroxylase PuuD [Glaciecola petra]|uniref:Urate hydroxylase PuuD n=1 Tax=Glaciecola petra TaxID=3075602 RepID=A0ABU2ZVZ2_9ALTE|nr:urate hydroxylase PuuD [Aestuariibacter sp. P117]MDT0596183.1 urate hydroxylase PuuD [Aestuariibacter sp. P117]